ncbi:MAG TPA: glycosyltransferase [Ktedonobacterales bacterium]|nr:glycosyltransferase [Ktedonobacterales bacterium]
MVIQALEVALCWFALSSTVLFLFGRRLGGPSAAASLALIVVIEVAGAVVAAKIGVPAIHLVLFTTLSTTCGVIVIWANPDWNPAGHAAWLFALDASLLYALVALALTFLTPVGLITLVLGCVLLALQLAGIGLALSFTYELLDVICRRRWRFSEARPPRIGGRQKRQIQAAQAARGEAVRRSRFDAASAQVERRRSSASDWQDTHSFPRVALHVPCHDEPSEVVIQTLQSLARLDYPKDAYQVFVVDNNTQDPTLWRPLAAACDRLGFTFLHLEQWPGFKSGALNYALALTPLNVDIIGVVDADYHVQASYLRDLVGYFDDPQVAFVQTPQDYRDYRPESTFYQRACYHAYRYFFDLSMPSRNERNAIIFGGTMGLIRANALREIGGWDEWCITEDAEASLRLLMRGYHGRFVNHTYGKGLMPLDFDALKRQRFRWCFGGVQILRKHWPALLPWAWRARSAEDWAAPGLTGAQRYHYLTSALQWFSDVITFGSTALLLVIGVFAIAGRPVALPVVGGPLLALPLVFWGIGFLRTLWGLRATRACTWGEAIGALGILWSLSWVVTLACIQGLISPRGIFLRTPKTGRATVLRAVRSATVETTLGVACWGVSAWLLFTFGAKAFTLASSGGQTGASTVSSLLAIAQFTPWWAIGASTLTLGVLSFVQGSVYLSAPFLCLLSLRTAASAQEVRRRALSGDSGEGIAERRLLAGAFVVVGALTLLLVAANLIPQSLPSGSPVGVGLSHTLTNLLGASNPATTPTAGSASGGGQGGPTATQTATGASPTPSGGPQPTVSTTPTDTPHPGATKTPSGRPAPTPRASPTPRLH